jgi:hypothetical protein
MVMANKKQLDIKKVTGYEVKCLHGNFIREYVTVIYKPKCGCEEVEICSGCGKENCTGCPAGTSKTVRTLEERNANN